MGKKEINIDGVNLPVVPAEPCVVEAFARLRPDAIQGAGEEVDCTREIEELLRRGKRRLATRPRRPS